MRQGWESLGGKFENMAATINIDLLTNTLNYLGRVCCVFLS
jgi:hypothetical protein